MYTLAPTKFYLRCRVAGSDATVAVRLSAVRNRLPPSRGTKAFDVHRGENCWPAIGLRARASLNGRADEIPAQWRGGGLALNPLRLIEHRLAGTVEFGRDGSEGAKRTVAGYLLICDQRSHPICQTCTTRFQRLFRSPGRPAAMASAHDGIVQAPGSIVWRSRIAFPKHHPSTGRHLPSCSAFVGCEPQILDELRAGADAGDEQAVASAGAGDVQEVALGLEHLR